ncbi:MAG: heavy metal-binding domain-containing protein [Saprospiraceae bacterium]
MKPLNFIAISLSVCLVLSIGCNSKKTDPVVPESVTTNTDGHQNTTPTDTTTVGTNGEQHFICPNHKDQGGPVEGNCQVCGTAYIHNDAFHKGQPIPEPQMKIDPVTHMAVPTHTEAQNSRGAYHFICPNGDPGGAGVAGKCSKCGADLVHNQAFHSN